MAILQDIERRIEELSPSGLQQLGEAYLLSKDRNKYAAFLRIGTKLGKDKTVKGTPDTLVYTYNKGVTWGQARCDEIPNNPNSVWTIGVG